MILSPLPKPALVFPRKFDTLVEAAEPIEFEGKGRAEVYQWITQVLRRQS